MSFVFGQMYLNIEVCISTTWFAITTATKESLSFSSGYGFAF